MELLQTTCPRTGAEIYDYVSEFEDADIANAAIIEQVARDLGLLPDETETDSEIWDDGYSDDFNDAAADAFSTFRNEQFRSF